MEINLHAEPLSMRAMRKPAALIMTTNRHDIFIEENTSSYGSNLSGYSHLIYLPFGWKDDPVHINKYMPELLSIADGKKLKNIELNITEGADLIEEEVVADIISCIWKYAKKQKEARSVNSFTFLFWSSANPVMCAWYIRKAINLIT